ncbi:hypothetical protein MKY34_13075 [Sporosarcina sp. FSL K6-1522]|uniref:hypothetical protein n=1 Tax=Sporosarcina sp. FSL K6-1522 TaxID=2921554 RepID=UPI00315B0F4E
MGFYYLLMLFIGIVFLIVGAMKKGVSRSVKIVIMLFVLGVLFIFTSLIRLMPGSSDLIAGLLKIS